jgi:hypothetical protein
MEEVEARAALVDVAFAQAGGLSSQGHFVATVSPWWPTGLRRLVDQTLGKLTRHS